MFTVTKGKPRSPELGTPKYPTRMFLSSHQVCNSKILSGSSFKVLFPHYYPQISLFETKKWQFGIIPLLGVVSTISVSLLSMRIMLQHITPPAYRRVRLSVVHFHHLSLTRLFLKTKQPFLQLTLLHPIVFEILKKHGVIFS